MQFDANEAFKPLKILNHRIRFGVTSLPQNPYSIPELNNTLLVSKNYMI
jgi:hypothetical protein